MLLDYFSISFTYYLNFQSVEWHLPLYLKGYTIYVLTISTISLALIHYLYNSQMTVKRK